MLHVLPRPLNPCICLRPRACPHLQWAARLPMHLCLAAPLSNPIRAVINSLLQCWVLWPPHNRHVPQRAHANRTPAPPADPDLQQRYKVLLRWQVVPQVSVVQVSCEGR